MDYNRPRLIDELAAQYALGTLRGPARRRFERLCRENEAALAEVRRWEDRLLQLAIGIVPVQPSSAVWAGILRRINRGTGASAAAVSAGWRRWLVAASAVMVMAVAVWWAFVLPPSTLLVASIVDQQSTVLWRIETPPDRATLVVKAMPAVAVDARHAYELWALPQQSGGAPVSLGLMPQRDGSALQLNDVQRQALADASQIAISLEPPGGSPTGAPTGPVLFTARVNDTSRG